MQKRHTLKIKYLIPFVVLGLYLPTVAFAGLLAPAVPVSDEKVQGMTGDIYQATEKFRNAFQKYVEGFDKRVFDDENSSLRTLLSLNPPAGTAAELVLEGRDEYTNGGKTQTLDDLDVKNFCDTRPITNPNRARPSENGAWQQLLDDGYADDSSLPNFGTVRVNDSTSLTCLMQEMVEYNKLQVNLQIHALLRDYINTALSASLSQRTSGMIAKANLDWVKKGNVITRYDSDGVPISQESFALSGTNPEDYKRALLQSRTNTIKDRLTQEDPEKPSLGICQSFKYETARQMLRNAQTEDADPLDSLSDEVGCQLVNKENPSTGLFANEDDIETYYKDPTVSNLDPFTTYMKLLSNSGNTKEGAKIALESSMMAQKDQIKTSADTQYVAGQGFLPTRECDPNDPNCDVRYSKITNPGSLTSYMTQKAATQQSDYIANADTPEKYAAAPTNNFSSTNIMSQGIANYDTNDLYPNQPVGRYVGDFLNGIRTGYYDLQSGTIDWASGAMLQIYDSTMTNAAAFTQASSPQAVQ